MREARVLVTTNIQESQRQETKCVTLCFEGVKTK